MLTTRIFRPTMSAGLVYARLAGTAGQLQSIGGVAELVLNVDEEVKKQKDYSRAGGGNRAQVNRIDSVTMSAKMQDLNPVNLARAMFGATAAVVGSTVAGEAVVAHEGGLIKLAHLDPTAVVVKKGAVTINMAGNYEVRPEGIFVLDGAADIVDNDALTVDYAYGGYDVIEALTQTAPTLEMLFGGLNEALDGAPSTVELYRVKLGALKSWNLINDDFATLDIEGEVLMDPTKVGAGVSKFFRVRMQ